MKRILSTCMNCFTVVFAALALGSTALAETPAKTGVAVRYADLDLSSAEGGRTLLVRISLAATKSCNQGAPTQLRPLYECRRKAVDRAVVGANIPMLSAAWESRLPATATRLAAKPGAGNAAD